MDNLRQRINGEGKLMTRPERENRGIRDAATDRRYIARSGAREPAGKVEQAEFDGIYREMRF